MATSWASFSLYACFSSYALGRNALYDAAAFSISVSISVDVSKIVGPVYWSFFASLLILRACGLPERPFSLCRSNISLSIHIRPKNFFCCVEKGTFPTRAFLHELSANLTARRNLFSMVSYSDFSSAVSLLFALAHTLSDCSFCSRLRGLSRSRPMFGLHLMVSHYMVY